jgi:TRAP-type uncharacterized transport system substrate-binding protein
MAAVTGERDEKAVLASGPMDGVHHRLAEAISRQLGPDVKIEAQTSPDSRRSLERLRTGEARFAFVQQVIAGELARAHEASELRVIGAVSVDYLHIFLKESVHAETVSDLQRLRLWAGEEESATRLTAMHLLDVGGVSLATFGDRLSTFHELPVREREEPWLTELVMDQLRRGRLDGALLLAPPGTTSICMGMGSGRLALLTLDRSMLRRLNSDGSSFRRQIVVADLPRGSYPNQPEIVTTLGVPVLLLARRGEDPVLAARVLEAAQEQWTRMAGDAARSGGCRLPTDFRVSASLEGSGLKRLEGLKADRSFRPGLGWPATVLLLMGLAIATRVAWKNSWHRRLRTYWRQDKLPFVILLSFVGSVLTITVSTYLLERNVNDNFSSIPEAFWSITVYLLSGLEDRIPYTFAGRAVATLGLLLGPAFLAVSSGWLAGVFIKRKRKMPQNLRNHYLLLNWNERAAAVVRELHHPLLTEQEGTSVIVVLTDDESLNLRQIKEAGSGWDATFEDFYVSIGDPTDRRALLNANAQDTRTILILADERYGDERTIRSLMALRRIARDLGVSGMHVVAELVNAANDGVIDELAEDFPGLLERVSGLRIRTCLLSQAALNPGLVGFYTDLLRVSDDTNEVYTQEIPDSAAGMSFREYAAMILRTGSDRPLIAVGVQRRIDGRPYMLTNPKPGEAGDILQTGDRLLLIAWEPPAPSALPLPGQTRAA